MRLLLLFVLLVPLVTAWSQCGSPSERVIKVDDIDVQTGEADGHHWVHLVLRGSASRFVSHEAVLMPSIRMGGIRVPLESFHLGYDVGPGPVEYVYKKTFDAPAGLVTHVRLVLAEGDDTVMCIRDLEVSL